MHFPYKDPSIAVALRPADNALILGQRLGAWCGHGPVLEQDIAITNITLDLIGQARSWYQYLATKIGGDLDEDKIAFLRPEHQYVNVLLVEQPNGDWAHTMVRQFLFDSAHRPILQALCGHPEAGIAEIAQKSLKEVTYHLRYSSEWMIRLGDGTEESNRRMQNALDELWRFGDEIISPDEVDQDMSAAGGPDLQTLAPEVQDYRSDILERAGLVAPESEYQHGGGKSGLHTEHLGYILAEMQYLPRMHPEANW